MVYLLRDNSSYIHILRMPASDSVLFYASRYNLPGTIHSALANIRPIWAISIFGDACQIDQQMDATI